MRHKNVIALSIALCISLSAMVSHGWIRSRWNFDEMVAKRGEALKQLPETLGTWERRAKKEVDQQVLNQLECEHYLDHVFYNAKLDATAEVAVFFGSAGPIAVHTPDVCYRNSDFRITGRSVLEVGDHRFHLVEMERKSIDKTRMHVCYGWLHDNRWEAADSPRFAFAFKRHLYKMQMVIAHPSMSEDSKQKKDDEEDVGMDTSLAMSFLTEFVDGFEAHALPTQ